MSEVDTLLIKVCRAMPSELKATYRKLSDHIEITVVLHNRTIDIIMSYKKLYDLLDIDKIVIYVLERIKWVQSVHDIIDNAIIWYN